jgi:ABC-type nickel/cobalt efflux system permease component RcnA
MEIYNQFLKQLTTWQYNLNSFISSHIRAINDDSSITMSITVLGIAFIYGLIHAAGPGHGKAIVGLYFSGNRNNEPKKNYSQAFEMGYLIAIVHTISALVTTFSLYLLLKTMFYKHFRDTYDSILHISSIMIIIVGLYIIYEAYKNKKEQEKLEDDIKSKSKYAVAISAAIVPCPGVMTITLFSIIQKKYILGILSAISMSIGMGLTISLAGILGILFHKQTSKFTKNIGFILQMASGGIIILLGLFLFNH